MAPLPDGTVTVAHALHALRRLRRLPFIVQVDLLGYGPDHYSVAVLYDDGHERLFLSSADLMAMVKPQFYRYRC